MSTAAKKDRTPPVLSVIRAHTSSGRPFRLRPKGPGLRLAGFDLLDKRGSRSELWP